MFYVKRSNTYTTFVKQIFKCRSNFIWVLYFLKKLCTLSCSSDFSFLKHLVWSWTFFILVGKVYNIFSTFKFSTVSAPNNLFFLNLLFSTQNLLNFKHSFWFSICWTSWNCFLFPFLNFFWVFPIPSVLLKFYTFSFLHFLLTI